MCAKIVFCILFTTSLSLCHGKGLRVYNNITDGEYNSMPKVFDLDNFDSCLILRPTLYCYTTIQLTPINPQKPSKTWNIIQEVISLPRNFRHDKLRHGICIPKSCPKIPKKYYATGNGTEGLWKGISECYNKIYKDMGLKAAVVVTHCENEEPFFKVDTLDIAYAIIMMTLLAVSFLATIINWCVTNKTNPKELNHVDSTAYSVIKAFSFINNWHRFRAEGKTEESKMFAPIQGVRVYNIFFVIASHTLLTRFSKPIYNPKYVEDATTHLQNMFFSNGSLICQTTFCISGWLLSYGLCVAFENKKLQLKHLFFIFVNRYLRLVPLLLVVIGFEVTWMRHMARGPMWERSVGDEFKNCRNNWLWTILFINNYHKVPEICLQQTWYLSVDMQGFTVGLFIMMLALNNRQHIMKILSATIIICISIAFANHYYMEYDIQLRAYAESLHTLYLEDGEWVTYFVAGHVSASSYMQGLVFGYYFYKLKKEKRPFITSTIVKVIWIVVIWSVPITTILMGGLFYQEGSEYTRLQAALYQSISRYIFSLTVGIGIFGMSFGLGGPMVSVCNWAPMQILARSTFSVYLIHTIHQRLRTGLMRAPVYLTDYIIIVDVLGDAAISFIIGIFVTVLVEMPISALQKLYLAPAQKPPIDDTKTKTQ